MQAIIEGRASADIKPGVLWKTLFFSEGGELPGGGGRRVGKKRGGGGGYQTETSA